MTHRMRIERLSQGLSSPVRGLAVTLLLFAAAACSDRAASSADAGSGAAGEDGVLRMVMHYDPGCGCCSDWAAYMREQGFELDLRLADNIVETRRELGVPARLASCHTAEIEGYLVEGHVPADAIRRMLDERPAGLGISAPGMPWGSPGMEMGDRVDTYPVVLFDAEGNESLFARYRGHELL